MSKFTAGPWQVDSHTVGRYKGVNIESPLGDRIASAGHSPFDLAEKQANARLISAAPELLNVAKRALDLIPQLNGNRETFLVEDLRNVITKAEGESNE